MDQATVDVKSAWSSKINWGELIKVLAALAATKGIDLSPEVQNDILMLIIAGGGIYTWVMRTWFTGKVTAASIAKVLIVAFAVSFLLPASSRAADVNSPVAAITKALTSTNACQAAGNCSGWYATFGMGAQSNSGVPNILANGVNSAFSDGLDIFAGGGYQLWQGQWLAGIEITGGYEFTSGGIKPAGGNFVGTEFVKLGYNFFPSSATSTPAPSQNPFLNLVSANFLAASTPSVIMGGVQRHGLSVAAIGAEIDTVISAGWSSYAQLYNSPSQQGLPDDTTFRIGLQRHF